MVVPLNYLKQGRKAIVVWIALPGDCEPLLSLWGIEPDALITCVYKHKGDGMSAYKIRHVVVALRADDSSKILVKLLDPL